MSMKLKWLFEKRHDMYNISTTDGEGIQVYRDYPVIAGYVQVPQVLIKNRNRITLDDFLTETPEAQIIKLSVRDNIIVRVPLDVIDPDGTLGL